MYSRSLGSRATLIGRPMAANTLNCPPPEPLQLQHRPTHAELSTNDPRPANNLVTANGQPIDARTHIINQRWRARQPDDLRHTLTNHRDGEPMGSLSRLGPKCFGPMIRGEKYPPNFKAPKEIEKYDPSYDPAVWLDTYLMAMGIAGHTDLLAARYLPLMMEGTCRQWINNPNQSPRRRAHGVAQSTRAQVLRTNDPRREVPAKLQGAEGDRKVRPLVRPRRLARYIPHGDGDRRPHRPASRPLPPPNDGGDVQAVDQHPPPGQYRLLGGG